MPGNNSDNSVQGKDDALVYVDSCCTEIYLELFGDRIRDKTDKMEIEKS